MCICFLVCSIFSPYGALNLHLVFAILLLNGLQNSDRWLITKGGNAGAQVRTHHQGAASSFEKKFLFHFLSCACTYPVKGTVLCIFFKSLFRIRQNRFILCINCDVGVLTFWRNTLKSLWVCSVCMHACVCVCCMHVCLCVSEWVICAGMCIVAQQFIRGLNTLSCRNPP